MEVRTKGSQTGSSPSGPRRSAQEISLAGFGVVELLERLGVERHVGALAGLVGRVNLVAAALDLDLADIVTVSL